MTIETLVHNGFQKSSTGLAGIDVQKLKEMRNEGLRSCFNHLDDTRYRMEFVARVRGREYINDAASRTINSTWYTLESLQGGLVWIVDACPMPGDYSRLVPPALRKVRMLIVVGKGDVMHSTFEGIIPCIEHVDTMAQALHLAYRYESDNEVKVIYSPACHNGKPTNEQGELFRTEVGEL
ncbi:MAG: hypothetical protein IJ760_03020 [Bacteroidales bacterium]|nr:hypothetical protein [Bacteroidales bacterium]